MFINIYSKGKYPANELSNFASHMFFFDNKEIVCMEAFLQSLKFNDVFEQNQVLTMQAKEAKLYGSQKKWKKYLYWQGRSIDRFSGEYFNFIISAYRQLMLNKNFKTALIDSGKNVLLHTIGKTLRKNTVLTWWEFTYILTKLRKEAILGEK